jgi:hypothetical protein
MPKKYTRKRRARRRTQARKIYLGGDNKCLFISMLGGEGLGNQLFIFAAGLVASKKTGLPLCVLLSKGNPHSKNPKETYEHLFKGPNVQTMKEEDVKPRMNSANSILNIPDVHGTGKWSNANIKYNSSSPKNAKLGGRLYQNYSGVVKVIPDVKAALMANEFSKKPEYREIEKATPAGSAFIHVRRGDYVGRGWTLDADYYIRGMSELNKDPRVKKICIISNEIEWCKNIPWVTDRPIEYYDSKNELEVLYKMMLCTAGAVISSSTFSSWGAMMGVDLSPSKNADTKIVYPQNWLEHDHDGNNPLVFPDTWIGIPNSMSTTTVA